MVGRWMRVNDFDCWQYSKNDQVCRIRLAGHNTILLPPKLLSEVQNLPEEQVSFAKEVYSRFNGRWTQLGDGKPNLPFTKTISRDLVSHTGKVIAELLNEINDYALPHELGLSTEWTAVPCLQKSLRIVALLTGRTFIGLPACRDEKWIEVMYVDLC